MFDSATVGIRNWLVGLFVQAIRRSKHPEERHVALAWLVASRDILAAGRDPAAALGELRQRTEECAAAAVLAEQVAGTVREYQAADMPWATKIAISATALAHGGAALPALTLAYLGAAGITAVIEGVVASPHSDAAIALVAARILRAEAARGAAPWFAAAMVDDPVAPRAAAMPKSEDAIRAALLAMPPAEFGRHVMSFFEKAGLPAAVTPNGGERGLDGYAGHPDGLVVVQCRQQPVPDRVGSPAVLGFRAVIADGDAWRGYVVATSCFTAGAVSLATREKNIVLIDGDALVRWHVRGLALAR